MELIWLFILLSSVLAIVVVLYLTGVIAGKADLHQCPKCQVCKGDPGCPVCPKCIVCSNKFLLQNQGANNQCLTVKADGTFGYDVCDFSGQTAAQLFMDNGGLLMHDEKCVTTVPVGATALTVRLGDNCFPPSPANAVFYDHGLLKNAYNDNICLDTQGGTNFYYNTCGPTNPNQQWTKVFPK